MALGIGVVGAGNISEQYLKNLAAYPDVELCFLFDLDQERAATLGQQFDVAVSASLDELLAAPQVELVVNLTPPKVHVPVTKAALEAGKHVWSEKPIGMDRAGGSELVELAAARGLRLGCAPDTILGSGLQTSLRMIAEGKIGTPCSATAIFQCAGPDLWHEGPEFLFQTGGGPTLDMGPYYVTALVQALGAVTRVMAQGMVPRAVRKIMEGPRKGTEFEVTVPTTAQVLLKHASGATSMLLLSFDASREQMGVLEFQGVTASLMAPDPNHFGGEVKLWQPAAEEPEIVECSAEGIGRGIGIVEMVRAIREDRPHRCTGELALHVLDVLLSIEEAIASEQPVLVDSTVTPMAPLDPEWTPLEER